MQVQEVRIPYTLSQDEGEQVVHYTSDARGWTSKKLNYGDSTLSPQKTNQTNDNHPQSEKGRDVSESPAYFNHHISNKIYTNISNLSANVSNKDELEISVRSHNDKVECDKEIPTTQPMQQGRNPEVFMINNSNCRKAKDASQSSDLVTSEVGREKSELVTMESPRYKKYNTVEDMMVDILHTRHEVPDGQPEDLPDLDSDVDSDIQSDEEDDDESDSDQEVGPVLGGVSSKGSATVRQYFTLDPETGDRNYVTPSDLDFDKVKLVDSKHINKVGSYSSELNMAKYHIPKKDNLDLMIYQDTRNTMQVFRDVLAIVNQKLSPSDIQLWSKVCNYDVRIPTVDKESGVALLRSEMLEMVRSFKERQDFLSKEEKELLKESEELAGRISARDLPDSVYRGGYTMSGEDKSDPENNVSQSKEALRVQTVRQAQRRARCFCKLPCQDGDQDSLGDGQDISDADSLECLCNPEARQSAANLQIFDRINVELAANDVTGAGEEDPDETSPGPSSYSDIEDTDTVSAQEMQNVAPSKQMATKFKKHWQNKSLINNKGHRILKVGDRSASLPYISILLSKNDKFNNQMKALLDSGADCNLVGVSRLNHMGTFDIQTFTTKEEEIVIETPSAAHRKICLGRVIADVYITSGDQYYQVRGVEFYVIDDKEFQLHGAAILGKPFLEETRAELQYLGKGKKILKCSARSSNNTGCRIKVECESLEEPFSRECTVQELQNTHGCTVLRVNVHNVQPGYYKVRTNKCNISPMIDKIKIHNARRNVMRTRNGEIWPVHLYNPVEIPLAVNHNIEQNDIFTLYLYTAGQDRKYEGEVTVQCDNISVTRPEEAQPGEETVRGECQHILHLAVCRHVRKGDSSYCSAQHMNDNSCPCPRQLSSEQVDIFNANKNKKLLNNIFTNKTSADPITPSAEDVDNAALDSIDLMQTASGLEDSELDIDHLSPKLRKKCIDLSNKFPEVWSTPKDPIGKFRYFESHLHFSPDSENNKQLIQKNRFVSFSKAPKAKLKIEELLKQGVLEYSSQPAKAISNFVLTKKASSSSGLRYNSQADKHVAQVESKDGSGLDYRLCIDLSTVNRSLLSEHVVVLPTMEAVKRLVCNSVMSSVDVKDGFFGLPLTEESKPYCTVYYENTLLNFTRVCQGMRNSPYLFIRSMDAALSAEIINEYVIKRGWSKQEWPYDSLDQWLLTYVDDIVFATKLNIPDYEAVHLRQIEVVLYCVSRAGFKLSKKKCKFLTDNIIYLGRRINSRDAYTEMATERASAILSCRIPLSLGELSSRLSFLFFSNENLFYARLIALPLTKMILSGKYDWSKSIAESWNNLKLLIMLRFRNYIFQKDRPSFMVVDSSKVSCAYVFYQSNEEGVLLPIQADCKIFSPAQLHQPSVLREAAGLVWAAEKCKEFMLQSTKPTGLVTDCSALTAIRRNRDFQHRFFQYAIFLSDLNMQVLFCPGKLLSVSDELSRSFQNCIVENNNPISEKQASIFPPIPVEIRQKMALMTPGEVTDYLLGSLPPENVDIFDAPVYKQPIHKADLERMLQSTIPEQQILSFLSSGWSNLHFYDNFAIKSLLQKQQLLSKTSFSELLKKWKLTDLKTFLDKEGFPGTFGSQFTRQPWNQGEKIDWTAEKEKYKNKKISKVVTRGASKKAGSRNIAGATGGPARPAVTDLSGEGEGQLHDSPVSSAVTAQSQGGSTKISRQSGWCRCHHSEVELEIIHLYSQFKNNIQRFFEIMNNYTDLVINKDKWKKYRSNYLIEPCWLKQFNIFQQLFGEVYGNLMEKLPCIPSDVTNNNDIENAKYLRMYPVHFSSRDFTLEFQATQVVVKAKRNIEVGAMDTYIIQGRIFIKLPVDCKIVVILDEARWFLDATSLNCEAIFTESIPVVNLTTEVENISVGQTLFIYDFSENPECQLFPILISESVIKNHLTNMAEFKIFSTRKSISNLIYSLVNSQANKHIIACLRPFEHSLDCRCGVRGEEGGERTLGQARQVNTVREPFSDHSLPHTKSKTEPVKKAEEWLGMLHLDDESRRIRALNAALFGQNLIRSGGIFQKEDIISAQEHFPKFNRLIRKCKENNGSYLTFVLKNGILYRNIMEQGSPVIKLALSPAIATLVMSSWHSFALGKHFSPVAMVRLVNNLFFVPGISEIAKKIYKSCLLCCLTRSKKGQKSFGTRRSYSEGPLRIGSSWIMDVGHLPASRNGYVGIVVLVEQVTSFVVAQPIKAVNSASVAGVIKSFLNFYNPLPESFTSDGGPEFSGKVSLLLKSLGIHSYCISPGHSSNTVGVAEVSIKIIKDNLRSLIYSTIGEDGRSRWDQLLPFLLRKINQVKLAGMSCSRSAMFFSHLHRTSLLPKFDITLDPSEMAAIQERDCQQLIKMREVVLGRLLKKYPHSHSFREGQILLVARSDSESSTHDDGTKSLSLPQPLLVKVLEIDNERRSAHCLILNRNQTKTYHFTELRPISARDISAIDFNTVKLLEEVGRSRSKTMWKKTASRASWEAIQGDHEIDEPEEDGETDGTGHPMLLRTVSTVSAGQKGSERSKNPVSILSQNKPRKQKVNIYSFKDDEYFAILEAIQVCLELGLDLTDDQEVVHNQTRDRKSNKFYNYIPAVELPENILRRRRHGKSVRFTTTGEDKCQTPLQIAHFSLHGEMLRLETSVSARELNVILGN